MIGGAVTLVALVAALKVWIIVAPPPVQLGVVDGQLALPIRMNSVSTQAEGAYGRGTPLPFVNEDRATTLARVLAVVAAEPRTRVVEQTDNYVHAVCRSALFGFRDDLEFYLDESANVVHVRSGSRLGYSDFGVNEKRVNRLRDAWRQAAADDPVVDSAVAPTAP